MIKIDKCANSGIMIRGERIVHLEVKMVDYYEKFKWKAIVEIKKEDVFLFRRIFYLHNLPGKIKEGILYSPAPYSDAIEAIVKAHYEENLSREYYRKIKSTEKLIEPVKRHHFRKHYLKIIGPVLLLIIVLIFIRFLLIMNIL